MNTIECAIEIDASPEQIFDVIHDYSVRLEWDPFLKRAEILDEASQAGRGVRTLCVATGLSGAGMETVYLSFARPKVAAVKMTKGPFYLSDFAASIRQLELPNGKTQVSYKFQLAGRPGWLRPVLDPILTWVFKRETDKRLASLKRYLEGAASVPDHERHPS